MGILEVQSGQLELTFGSSHKTSDLVADCLENWWQRRSQELGGVEELLPHLDNGPESRGRRTQFLARLVSFADASGLRIRLVYHPPYHSKYNPLERCWGVLAKHWNGALLRVAAAALGWASTMTWKGLSLPWSTSRPNSTKKACKSPVEPNGRWRRACNAHPPYDGGTSSFNQGRYEIACCLPYIIKRVLKRSVLVQFAREHPEYSAGDCATAETLISDFFHRLTCDSVSQFTKEQQRVVREKSEALEQTNQARDRLTRTVSHELRNVLNALTRSARPLRAGRRPGAVDARTALAVRAVRGDHVPVASGRQGTGDGVRVPLRPRVGRGPHRQAQNKAHRRQPALERDQVPQGGDIDVSFARVGATGWKLVGADTGIGIAREDMESLFGEFNRIRPNSAVDGTGLGLAICKEYAELLGGRIEAFSEAEQGTRFEVILPMTAAAAPLGESVGAAGVRVSPHSPAARAGR